MDIIEQLSAGLADRIAEAAPITVGIHGGKRQASGILWRADVVVASEQMFGEETAFRIAIGAQRIDATLAGRDPGTNVAVLKLEAPSASPLPSELPSPGQGTLPDGAGPPRVGSLAVVAGRDAAGGPTGRLAMVHSVGDSWHSMAGGRIDALIRLDCRLGADEGGPVLTPDGKLLGMSTAGPRRRTIVIPTATLARVVDPLLSDGRIARGWLGVGLQPVMIPDGFRQSAGRDSGLMVVSLVPAAPAEAAGVLPGDIVLDVDGAPLSRPRSLAVLLGPDRIGQAVAMRVLRAGAIQTVSVTVAARPAV